MVRERAVVRHRNGQRHYLARFRPFILAAAEAAMGAAANSAMSRYRSSSGPASLRVVGRKRRSKVTTGFKGRRFKRPKKRLYKPSGVSRFGCHRIVEKSVELSRADVVYVGHSFGSQDLLGVVWGSIVRKLFMKAGLQVTSMHQRLQGEANITFVTSPGMVRLIWRVDGSTNTNADYAIAADSTYNDIVDQLIIWLEATYNSSGHNGVVFQSISYYANTTAPVQLEMPAALIHLSGAFVNVGYTSKMTVQNQTGARGVGTDESSALDVANNPLSGKLYHGNGNTLCPSFANNTAAVTPGIAAIDSGLIDFNITNFSTEMTYTYHRPPSAAAFVNCRNAKNVSVNPGEMRTSFIKWQKKMSFNKFMTGMYPYLAQAANAPRRISLGKFAALGLDKRCRTVGDPNIQLAVELQCRYHAVFSEVRPSLVQDLRVV
ncbi:MAG: putative capsid protein [Circoviridae sp.]|nr:MAG: putative capsid protein [Circoviridae sp.]